MEPIVWRGDEIGLVAGTNDVRSRERSDPKSETSPWFIEIPKADFKSCGTPFAWKGYRQIELRRPTDALYRESHATGFCFHLRDLPITFSCD
jgi:hypothetical protein